MNMPPATSCRKWIKASEMVPGVKMGLKTLLIISMPGSSSFHDLIF